MAFSLNAGSGSDEDLMKRLIALVETDKSGRLKIPPERLAAERLDVQRAKIREVLSALDQFGFIERVQGSGTFLTVPRPYFMQVYFEIAMQLQYISFDSIEKTREMLELAIVEEAALRATDDDIKELRRLCDIITQSQLAEERIDADMAFHRLLATMTRNAAVMVLFQSISSVLQDVVRQRRMLLQDYVESSEKISNNHIAIVEAVAKRDPELARKAMAAHFSIWEQQYNLSIFSSVLGEQP